MTRLMGWHAAVAITMLACGISAPAHAGQPQCLLGTSQVGARLVCDQDACVRQRPETDCTLTQAAVVRDDRVRSPSSARKRIVRDDVAILLARLD